MDRFVIPADQVEVAMGLFRKTEDPVHLTFHLWANRYTVAGVPGRLVDVCVDSRLPGPAPHPRERVIIERVDKTGRFDGSVRRRYTLRWAHSDIVAVTRPADFRITIHQGVVTVSITPWGSDPIVETWCQLATNLDIDSKPLSHVLMWHWDRYYKHLPHGEAAALADVWAAENDGVARSQWDLSDANRSASRALYRLSRDLGWHKLTARERAALCLEATWVSDTVYAAAQTARYEYAGESPTGCGEATTSAAHGRPGLSWFQEDYDG